MNRLFFLTGLIVFSFLGCVGSVERILGQTDTPVISRENATVRKTAIRQPTVEFLLSSTHGRNSVWKAYDTSSGRAALNTVIVNYFPPHTLRLTSTTGDIPDGRYWVAVTEKNMWESRRILLTVLPFIAPRTATPTSDLPAKNKEYAAQNEISFILSSEPFSDVSIWNVYGSATDTITLQGVSVTYDSNLNQVTLTNTETYLQARTYWVAVAEYNMLESERLALTVDRYIPPEVTNSLRLRFQVNSDGTAFTATPSTGNPWNAVLNDGANVRVVNNFGLVDMGGNNGWVNLGSGLSPVLADNPEFTVETFVFIPSDANLGGNGRFIWSFSNAATASGSSGRYMWLRASDQVFAIATSGWGSERRTAARGNIERGRWNHIVMTKDSLNNYRLFVNGQLMGGLDSSTAISAISPFNYNYLARPLFPNDNFLRYARYYQLNIYNKAFTQAQIQYELGAAVIMALLPIESRTPVISPANSAVAKVRPLQRQVSFIFDTAPTGTWNVYANPTDRQTVPDVSASVMNRVLTLSASGNDIPIGTYYVSVTEPGAIESTRVALTILPYVPPERQVTVTFGGIPQDPVSVTGEGQTVSKNGGSLIVSVTDPQRFDRFVWRLNGIVQTETTGTFNLSGTPLNALPNGEHRLMVLAFSNNVPWSREIAFTITD